jgi:hypothetical protein
MTDERERVAEELRRVADEAHRKALLDGGAPLEFAPLPVPAERQPLPRVEAPPPMPLPAPPDPKAVNAAWKAEPPPPRGFQRLIHRLLERIFRPRFEAQQAFNARQVQLDNETLTYLSERFAATHRHYDHVLGLYGRHIEEIDERHRMLQDELVSHVHDLVKRIDLVLAEVERGRLSREAVIEDLRGRVARLEEALQRRV